MQYTKHNKIILFSKIYIKENLTFSIKNLKSYKIRKEWRVVFIPIKTTIIETNMRQIYQCYKYLRNKAQKWNLTLFYHIRKKDIQE
jgi:hypothetical protein